MKSTVQILTKWNTIIYKRNYDTNQVTQPYNCSGVKTIFSSSQIKCAGLEPVSLTGVCGVVL